MPTATKSAKPFASLGAALTALDAPDIIGDLELLADDASAADHVRLSDAIAAVRCAETVETMTDLAVNLRDAAEALADVEGAGQVSAKLARLLARCGE